MSVISSLDADVLYIACYQRYHMAEAIHKSFNKRVFVSTLSVLCVCHFLYVNNENV
jgi:hypothetical protein